MTRSRTLKVAPDVALPVSILTDSTTIFGRKRSGKSNTAAVLVEEALDLHAQAVIFDPKGDWWGIRSSFDGKEKGYPVVVIGGAHGRVLNPYAGAVTAEWVLLKGYSVVLDLSLLKPSEIDRFCGPFLETIRRRKTLTPGPILIVVDEADELAPQDDRERARVMETYRALVWMVKRGGAFGVGTVAITQRPASLAKNITTQSETLISLLVLGSQDLDAVDDALKHHVEGDTKKERADAQVELLREIVRLPKGSAVLVSANEELKGKIHRIAFRRRRTFDSGATPEFGKTVATPKVVAEVDLVSLTEAMEKAEAEVKENDPALLKARIRELEKAKAPVAVSVAVPGKVREVVRHDLAKAEVKKLEKIAHDLSTASVGIDSAVNHAASVVSSAREAVADFSLAVGGPKTRTDFRDDRPWGAKELDRHLAKEPPALAKAVRDHNAGVRAPESRGILPPRQQKILDTISALVTFKVPVTPVTVAAWMGVHQRSKGYANDLSAMRSAGYLSGLTLTELGARSASTGYANMTTNAHVQAFVLEPLPPRQRAIAEAIILRGVPGIPTDQLAEFLHVHPRSKGFSNDLSALRGRGIIQKGTPLRAASFLFPFGLST